MHIQKLELRNWLRYKGTHELELNPLAYGVVAERIGNPDSSNWSGKSSILEAVVFALYGHHRFKLEDEWITHGENGGGVALYLDGLTILRQRKRGKSTQIWCKRGEEESHQEDAQRVIVEAVGLSEKDFFATCYFEQKKMSRFIMARPAERMEIVSDWLNLGPLQAAEDYIGKKLRDFTTRLQVLVDGRDRMRTDLVKIGTSEDLDERIRIAEENWKEKVDRLRVLQSIEADFKAWTRDADRMAAQTKMLTELEMIERELAGAEHASIQSRLEELRQIATDKSNRTETARLSLVDKTNLMKGEFDGVCPVAGIECPARKEINSRGSENRQLYEQATSAYSNERVAYQASKTELEQLDGKVSDLKRKETRAQALKDAVNLQPKAQLVRPDFDIPEMDRANRESLDLTRQITELKHARGIHDGLVKSIETAELDIANLNEEVRSHRASAAIFGRNGAQRRMAERALFEIETGANALLNETGIDLSVKVSWAKEASKTLASQCYECGAQFPLARKMKVCDACGTERGPKLDERLDIELSDRSGAAEDLAGIAFQLSAAAWLRKQRDTTWSVVLIDEAFSACDAANRKALAAHLSTMLRSTFGFSQALLVSHTSDTIDMMPGKILVTGDKDSSTVQVV